MAWSLKRKTTQLSVVKEKLLNGETITSKEAFDLGITRLAVHINTLRNQGMNIVTLQGVSPNRYGGLSHYAIYKLMD